MADIFIAYAREDLELARRLAQKLEKHGWSVFWDRRIPAGRRFAEVISQQLLAAKCVIVLWSHAAIASDWVLDEADEARKSDKLVPALIETVDPPMGFRRIHAANLIGWQGEGTHAGLQQLLADIGQNAPLSPGAAAAQDKPKPASVPQVKIKTNPQDQQPYVWIPPGRFEMGCSPGDKECFDDEEPRHDVTISRGFWMGQTPVTVGANKRFVQAARGEMPPSPDFPQDDKHPVVNVTWDEAVGYCQWAGGRLPTEAEWEYAARAGSAAARYGELDEIAWYADNAGCSKLDSAKLWDSDQANYYKRLRDNGNQTHRVGKKTPNEFRLCDTLGNVWEWCADWYGAGYYELKEARDPEGPPAGSFRVLRGGSWNLYPRNVRVSCRLSYLPDGRYDYIGFRCVREVIP